MTTVLTTRRAAPLVRRLPDAEGNLVTYLSLATVCEVVGISNTSVTRWAEQALVRFTDRLNGSRNYAVVDVARLKLMTRKESEALGLRRTPERHLRRQAEWHDERQTETRQRAEYHGEPWDDFDDSFLVTALAEGREITVIAKTLGRTYDAVECRIQRLRDAGDLEREAREDDGWQERTLALLTLPELASLIGDRG